MAEDEQVDENGYPVQPQDENDPRYKDPTQVQNAPDAQGQTAAPAPAKAPVGAFDRESFKNDWLAQNAHTSADMDNFLKDHPEYAQSVSRSGKDIWNIADPRGTERVDALFDESGAASHASWTDPGGMGTGGAAGMPAPGGGGGGAAGGAGGSGVYGTGNQAMDDAMHSALMSMLQRNSSPVTAKDVGDRFGPLDAIKQRNAMEGRNAAAERAAFQGSSVGGAGGSLDAEQNKITENLSQDEMGLMSGLMGEEMQARRADVMNALQFAQGEEKIGLQKQLADMDNELRREQMAQSGSQFQQSLGQNQSQFDASMDDSDAWKEYIYNQQFNQGLE